MAKNRNNALDISGTIEAMVEAGNTVFGDGFQALSNLAVATLVSAISSGAMGCISFPQEPTPVESEQEMLLGTAKDRQLPEFIATQVSVDFPMPEGVRGKMSPEDFKKKSAEITVKILKIFQETSSEYYKLQSKSDKDERLHALLEIIFSDIFSIFKSSDPLIAEDIEMALKRTERSYEFIDHVNKYLKPNGYFLMLMVEDSKTNIHVFKLGKTQVTTVDDGYMTYNANGTDVIGFGGSDQDVWWQDQEDGTRTLGMSIDNDYFLFSFNYWGPEIYPYKYVDENGSVLSYDDYVSRAKAEILEHEADHVMTFNQFPFVSSEKFKLCPIPDKFKYIFPFESTRPITLSELSGYGTEIARTRILNRTIAFAATFDPKSNNGLVPLLLPHAILAVAPDNEIKRSFITSSMFNLSEMDRKEVVDTLVENNPNFTIDHNHQVGRIMRAVAQELFQECEAKAVERTLAE